MVAVLPLQIGRIDDFPFFGGQVAFTGLGVTVDVRQQIFLDKLVIILWGNLQIRTAGKLIGVDFRDQTDNDFAGSSFECYLVFSTGKICVTGAADRFLSGNFQRGIGVG